VYGYWCGSLVAECLVLTEDLKGLPFLVIAVVCLDSDYSSVWSGLYKFFVCEVSVQRFYAAASCLVTVCFICVGNPKKNT